MRIKNIYVENQIKDHPNTIRITNKLKFDNLIFCDHYSEVFNSTNQNFRIQKKFPSLILAKKLNNLILKTPKNFTIGFDNNFYFSHMLNCIYDCKYCYLQGMLNSANYLIFVNYEDFLNSIKKQINSNKKKTCFFSGYDCDSLAMESITNFLDYFIPHFKNLSNGILEIRSKSINIDILKNYKPLPNVIPAFSLNPDFIINDYEDKTPKLLERLKSMKKLQDLGWDIGIRFDPIIWLGKENKYKKFFCNVFEYISLGKIHSVTLGGFRMPPSYIKKISKIRPNDYFIQMENSKRILGIKDNNLSQDAKEFCKDQILKFLSTEKFFMN